MKSCAQALLGFCPQAVTETVEVAEVAFTGDTSAAYLADPGSGQALHARLLIMEATFLDDDVSLEHAQVGMLYLPPDTLPFFKLQKHQHAT
jgi:ribonuclease BN (tRNA processing enzyme)